MRVGVDGLVHVDVPVVTPAQRVQIVVRVLGAETGKDDMLFVRLAIAIGVLEIKQLVAGGDVTSAVAVGQNAGGNEQTVGEHGGFVGLVVAVGVFEHDNGIGGGLAGFDLRIDFRAGDPEPALGVPADFNRLGALPVLRPATGLGSIGTS